MEKSTKNIIIGKNCIRYYNEVLKASNVSRTWIFRFHNVEKKAYEIRQRKYEESKKNYERMAEQNRKNQINFYFILTGILVFICLILVGTNNSVVASVFFLLAIIIGFLGYLEYKKKKSEYPEAPPIGDSFPDKYGLSIEMNSGYVSTFTAIGKEGVRILRKIQDDINDADTQQEVTINMYDNSITVENNDGIISTGDNTENIIEETKVDEGGF